MQNDGSSECDINCDESAKLYELLQWNEVGGKLEQSFHGNAKS